jgi:hypothetical protein
MLVVALLGVAPRPTLQAQQSPCWDGEYVWGHTGKSTEPETRLPPDATEQIIASTNDAHVFTTAVPPGVIRQMDTISVSNYGGESQEYAIEWGRIVPPFAGLHYHAIARNERLASLGTPVLFVPPADANAVVMLPGERLAARSNGGWTSMMLLWTGYEFPEACLPVVKGWRR